MAKNYQNPEMVLYPKKSVADLEVVYNSGYMGWSVAKLVWQTRPAVGVRWNGGDDKPGTPQSRGLPTWFILPKELSEAVLDAVSKLNNRGPVVKNRSDLIADAISTLRDAQEIKEEYAMMQN